MSKLRALWIDEDQSFVRTMLSDGQEVMHLTNFNPDESDQIPWSALDLILMELKIHGNCSLQWISAFRKKRPEIPVVLITSHANKELCIEALNLDVTRIYEKPVSSAQFKSIFDTFSQSSSLKLNHDRKAVFSKDQWIDLTSTEYRILETLNSARKRLTRSELQSAVWPASSISENNLDTHLTNLKRKIPELNQILNVKRGLGYYLEPQKH